MNQMRKAKSQSLRIANNLKQGNLLGNRRFKLNSRQGRESNRMIVNQKLKVVLKLNLVKNPQIPRILSESLKAIESNKIQTRFLMILVSQVISMKRRLQKNKMIAIS